jgi:phage I-like protein
MAKNRRCAVALATSLPSGGSPPKQFLIWAFGEVETTKGTFLFDDAAARAVMESYRSYGNRLTIDYEHKAVDPNRRAGDGKAAGSFEIELRTDGLYAVDVRWTPPAFEALTNKEWLYFSPYFSAEAESGRILELINLALTNIPATMNMRPLVAADRSVSRMDKTEGKDPSGGGNDEDVEAGRRAMEAAKKSARDRLAKAMAELEAAKAECSAFRGEEDGNGEDDQDAPPSAEDDDDSQIEDDDPNGTRREDDELGKPPPGKGGEGQPEDDDARPPKRPASTPASAAVATGRRTGRASTIEAAARSLTGKSDEGEIIGALTALADASRSNVSLSRRLADLERKLRRSDVESMVTRAIKTGKLTPAEREWALGYGMESPSKLRGYLDVTPARARMAGTEYREPPRPGGDAGNGPTLAVTLSADERKICENTGIDPEKFAAVKHRPIRVG